MMRRFCIVLAFLALAATSFAQVAGGAATVQGPNKEQDELNNRGVSPQDFPPAGTNYIDASVLANVKADEYVAVLGVIQEGSTPADCSQKMNATLDSFTAALKALAIPAKDVFVDYVIENRIYKFDLKDNVAKEVLDGFELKKNVSIHYRKRDLLDAILAAAAKSEIYDLIKVDYIVQNTDAIHAQLMKEAAAIIKQKAADDAHLLGVSVGKPTQVIAQRFKAYFPTEMYGSYQASEGEEVQLPYNPNYVMQRARRAKTFYFNPLDAKLFDKVISPVVLEPVVQFTIYLKVEYVSGQQEQPRKSGSARKGKKS